MRWVYVTVVVVFATVIVIFIFQNLGVVTMAFLGFNRVRRSRSWRPSCTCSAR